MSRGRRATRGVLPPLGLPVLALGAALLAGCGGAGTRHPSQGPGSSTAPSAATASAPRAAPPAPPAPVILELKIPMIGLSSAPTVRFTTTAFRPAVSGAVKPAGATVYLLEPDGTRTAVNPRRDGSFRVHVKLLPGPNTFSFTAARLGSRSAHATVELNWQGRGAQAMQRRIDSDPAKFLPAASAGLNRKLPALGNLPAISGGSAAATFQLDPIRGGIPPAAGGPGRWLGGFELTEYFPSLEAWFVGEPVAAAGLPGRHRIDWLYSARGLSMEGDGIGLDGRQYHVADLGSGGWLTASGRPGARFGSGASAPYWRTGGFWRTAGGGITFPLAGGGWANGAGVRYVPPPGITFAPGPSRPLHYLRSVAVDPRLIPLGSHIFIPAYRAINGGWFEADDTGGAIVGRHIDVFRPPPSSPTDSGNFATGQRVYIVAPGVPVP
jgi:3D (Asp-Asp-Asp) domain-containing protein